MLTLGGALACCLFRRHLGGAGRLGGPAQPDQEEVKTSYDNCLYLQPSYLPGLAYLPHHVDKESSCNSTPLRALCSATQL